MNTVWVIILVACSLVIFGTALPHHKHHFRSSGAGAKSGQGDSALSKGIEASTWNIAAINNNPFEYWITWSENDKYVKLMQSVSTAVKNPGVLDVPIKKVFTEEMFSDLSNRMGEVGFKGLDQVKAIWDTFKERPIISKFLKDEELGAKRLVSMPDRTTNTIEESNGKTLYRPTPINCFEGDLGTSEKWWNHWKKFMFETEVSTTGKGGVSKTQAVYKQLLPIQKAKYPAISLEEEKVSIPLSAMCTAIFDAILVHLLNTFKGTPWQPIRQEMCEKLNKKKNARTMEILNKEYQSVDIIFLQEVGKGFVEKFNGAADYKSVYELHLGADADPNRDQNSVILLKRGQYSFVKDVTKEVMGMVEEGKKLPVSKGDLVVIQATRDMDGAKFLLASFHGDTNGLATEPILELVLKYSSSRAADHKLLFGMDANSHVQGGSKLLDVTSFKKFFSERGLNSCFGQGANPNALTTFNARTYLQPQLNKAVAFEERDTKGDKNPKDFILFFDKDFQLLKTKKDNTGLHKYIEGMVFPTLSFPSDHGITTMVVEDKIQKQK